MFTKIERNEIKESEHIRVGIIHIKTIYLCDSCQNVLNCQSLGRENCKDYHGNGNGKLLKDRIY